MDDLLCAEKEFAHGRVLHGYVRRDSSNLVEYRNSHRWETANNCHSHCSWYSVVPERGTALLPEKAWFEEGVFRNHPTGLWFCLARLEKSIARFGGLAVTPDTIWRVSFISVEVQSRCSISTKQVVTT